MKWQDVNYLYDGLDALVIYDEADLFVLDDSGQPQMKMGSPELVKVRGVIECENYDDMAALITNKGRQYFQNAAVMIVPPRGT